ncbi:MAG: hypothetical protein M3N93_05655 [Acidobacteriota bacterium]|nr:hypothetical protein [Acidobacteriota bacterium]
MRTRAVFLFGKAMEALQARGGPPEWHDSDTLCALTDSERHLGHAVRVGEYWVAYDATHFNPTSDGFRIIGTFPTLEEAKEGIVNSVSLSWLRSTVGTEVTRSAHLKLRKM